MGKETATQKKRRLAKEKLKRQQKFANESTDAKRQRLDNVKQRMKRTRADER